MIDKKEVLKIIKEVKNKEKEIEFSKNISIIRMIIGGGMIMISLLPNSLIIENEFLLTLICVICSITGVVIILREISEARKELKLL